MSPQIFKMGTPHCSAGQCQKRINKYHMDRVTLDFSQENKEINSLWVGRKVKLDSLFLNLLGHESPID